MRYLSVAALVAVFSFSSFAQDGVIPVSWDVIGIADSGVNLASGVKAVEAINLDTRWGQYGSVNGVVRVSDGISIAAIGSCFFASGNALACELQVREVVYFIVLDADTGNGELSIIDADGGVIDSGAMIIQ